MAPNCALSIVGTKYFVKHWLCDLEDKDTFRQNALWNNIKYNKTMKVCSLWKLSNSNYFLYQFSAEARWKLNNNITPITGETHLTNYITRSLDKIIFFVNCLIETMNINSIVSAFNTMQINCYFIILQKRTRRKLLWHTGRDEFSVFMEWEIDLWRDSSTAQK